MAEVLHIDRADGCRPEIHDLLAAWKLNGGFDILVAPDGGHRVGPAAELAQANFYATGLSRARTLKETPHGRRCAVDCWPVGFNPHRDFKSQPGMREKFKAWGQFVRMCGLVWGGDFAGFGLDGDMPHAELPGWATRFSFPDGEPVLNHA